MASRQRRPRGATRARSGAAKGLTHAAGLTHLDAAARPTMVDVGDKTVTHRIAEAEARVWLPAVVAQALRRSGHRTKKGPVLDTAILAGVMATKRTSELIPFCHPLVLEHCQVSIDLQPAGNGAAKGNGALGAAVAVVRCRVSIRHKTGVEMEALTGASIAALTIYDMCKALSHDIRIERVHLLSKSGGKRPFQRPRRVAPREP